MSKFFFYPFLGKHQEKVFLSEEETKHLLANRVKVGEKILLWNGRGFFFEAYLEAYCDKKARIKIAHLKREDVNCCSYPKLQLFQALLKNASRVEWLIEKATEIGVFHIYFFPAKHSLKTNVSKNSLKRWKKIALSACKQSGRPFLPRISFLSNIEKVISKIELASGMKFTADLRAQKRLTEFLRISSQNLNEACNVLLVTGPEGDFSDFERELLAKAGCIPVLLSKTVLRSETATIFGLSVIKSHFEDVYANEICHQNLRL